MNEALDDVRAAEARRLARDKRKANLKSNAFGCAIC
jgi:hypothetical protein